MTVDSIIDALIEKYYYYDKLVLEAAIAALTKDDVKIQEVKNRLLGEQLVEILETNENGTVVAISMHAKNLVNAGGYLYFKKDSPSRKPPSEPAFLREYKVSALRYYLFWPLLAFALLETVFIFWKII